MKKGTAVSLVLGIALLAGLVADVTAAENSLSKAMMTPQSRHVSSSAHQFGHAAVISKRAAMMDGFAGGAAPPSASSSAGQLFLSPLSFLSFSVLTCDCDST